MERAMSILTTVAILLALSFWAYATIQQENCAKGDAVACAWVQK